MIKLRYIPLLVLICLMIFSGYTRSDYLVWQTGAKIKIRKDYELLNRDNKIMGITVVGPSGKDAKVYIRPEDINWSETKRLNRSDVEVETDYPRMPASVDVENMEKDKTKTKRSGELVLQDKHARNKYGHTVGGGVFLNDTLQILSSVDIKVDFFNNAGDRLKTLNRKLTKLNLQPGDTHSFEFLVVSKGMDEKFKEYEIKLKWEK